MVGKVLLWLVLAYLVIGEPMIGRRMYRNLQTGKTLRVHSYYYILSFQWAMTVFVVVVFAASGVPLRLLGLYNPNGLFIPSGFMGGLMIGLLIGIPLFALVMVLQAKRGITTRSSAVNHVAALLPHTGKERVLFACIAVTAGICEEILFRGLPVYLFMYDTSSPFRNPGILILVITAVIFGLAHIYQGVKGVLAAGFLGLVFTGIYISTGALWLLMICHALIDLRALLIRVPEDPISR